MRWVTDENTENLCNYSLLYIIMCDMCKVQVGLFYNNEKLEDKKNRLSANVMTLRSSLSSDFRKNTASLPNCFCDNDALYITLPNQELQLICFRIAFLKVCIA